MLLDSVMISVTSTPQAYVAAGREPARARLTTRMKTMSTNAAAQAARGRSDRRVGDPMIVSGTENSACDGFQWTPCRTIDEKRSGAVSPEARDRERGAGENPAGRVRQHDPRASSASGGHRTPSAASRIEFGTIVSISVVDRATNGSMIMANARPLRAHLGRDPPRSGRRRRSRRRLTEHRRGCRARA